jgi:hypothetical protein
MVYCVLHPNYDFATKLQEGRDFFDAVSTLCNVVTGPLFSAVGLSYYVIYINSTVPVYEKNLPPNKETPRSAVENTQTATDDFVVDTRSEVDLKEKRVYFFVLPALT